MKTILMVKSIPGIWDLTDKFKFTGKWKCNLINVYCDTDVEFEIEVKVNFIKRWREDIPKYVWVDSSKFIEVNVCDDLLEEPDWDIIL